MIVSEEGAWDGKIKVLMINVPYRIHDSLKELIQAQDSMQMVGEAFDPIDLLLTVNDTEADVVIMGHPQCDRVPGICTHLLAEYPDLLVFTLSTETYSAFLYQRKITQNEIPFATTENLINTIAEAFSSPMC